MRIQRSAVALMVLALALGSSAVGAGIHGVVSTRRAPEPKSLQVLDVPVPAAGETIFSDPIYAVQYGTMSVQASANVPVDQSVEIQLYARTDPSRESVDYDSGGVRLGLTDATAQRYKVFIGLSAPQMALAVHCTEEGLLDDATDISVSVYLE